jgi:cell division protein FtsQ
MNKIVKYILVTFTAIAVVAYLLMAFVFVDNKNQLLVCKNINVSINDGDKFSFVDADHIKSILINCGEKIINEPLNKINTYKIKQILSKNHVIKSVNVFTTIDANLNVEIEQRHPIIRIQCENIRCYIDDTGYIFPLVSSKSGLHLPIVTGTIPAAPQNGFAGYIPKNGKLLNQLYEFAVFLKKDAFWNDMIEQINITDNKIEIIPQFAGHTVKLGRLDNFKPKLNKLQKFYKYALPALGWNKYKLLNIEYKNQIICKK